MEAPCSGSTDTADQLLLVCYREKKTKQEHASEMMSLVAAQGNLFQQPQQMHSWQFLTFNRRGCGKMWSLKQLLGQQLLTHRPSDEGKKL